MLARAYAETAKPRIWPCPSPSIARPCTIPLARSRTAYRPRMKRLGRFPVRSQTRSRAEFVMTTILTPRLFGHVTAAFQTMPCRLWISGPCSAVAWPCTLSRMIELRWTCSAELTINVKNTLFPSQLRCHIGRPGTEPHAGMNTLLTEELHFFPDLIDAGRVPWDVQLRHRNQYQQVAGMAEWVPGYLWDQSASEKQDE